MKTVTLTERQTGELLSLIASRSDAVAYKWKAIWEGAPNLQKGLADSLRFLEDIASVLKEAPEAAVPTPGTDPRHEFSAESQAADAARLDAEEREQLVASLRWFLSKSENGLAEVDLEPGDLEELNDAREVLARIDAKEAR